MKPDKIKETYYNIYLTSNGVRNGTYLEIFDFDSLDKFLKKIILRMKMNILNI